MVSPPAEVELNEVQVRSLLRAQHADLSGLALVELDSGWDNVLWRLGDDLIVRLPRREVAVALTVNEQRWLPQLAPRLPLPVSVPIRRGEPSRDYPWPLSILPWIEGCPGDRCELTNPRSTAERLARFLAALHRPAPPDAPHNPVRGVPLADRAESFETWISSLSTEIDAGSTREIWDYASSAPRWTQPARWLHGDLHPANVVIADGVLAGVVDFGDICAGDPATDLAAI